jgi:hypothetical protein
MQPGSAYLIAVSAAGPDDIWAVGRRTVASASAPKGITEQMLIEHWDGHQWSLVDIPEFGFSSSFLSRVSAASANDVWAVGGAAQDGGPYDTTLALHWDGSKWDRVPVAEAGYVLSGDLVAHAGNDVWIVGGENMPEQPRPAAAHWDGTAWNIIHLPFPTNSGAEGCQMSSVAVLGPDDIWAAGGCTRHGLMDGWSAPLVEHWNGKEWSIANISPSGSAGAGELGPKESAFILVARSSDNVWLVGQEQDPIQQTGFHQSYAQRWDGSEWRIVDTSGLAGVDLLMEADLAPTGELWTLSGSVDGKQVIARYGSICGTPGKSK